MKKNVIYIIIKAIALILLNLYFGFVVSIIATIYKWKEFKKSTLQAIIASIMVSIMMFVTNVFFWLILLYATGIIY